MNKSGSKTVLPDFLSVSGNGSNEMPGYTTDNSIKLLENIRFASVESLQVRYH